MGRVVKQGVGTVYVSDDEGNRHAFVAGQDVPDWAAEKMGDVIDDGARSEAVEDDKDTGAGAEQDAVPERPKGNASREAWAEYARAQGFDVAEDATRDDIIAAVDAD